MKTGFRKIPAVAFAGAAAFLAALLGPAMPGDAEGQSHVRCSWREDAGAVELLSDGRTVWRFNYAAGLTNVFFHPVALPGRSELTWLSPEDHPYHFALFFGWKFLNGINYWEQVPDGVTKWSDVRVNRRPDWSASISLDLQYRPRGAVKDVLTERRFIEIAPPAADGSYHMDWRLEFTAADESVVMDRAPPDTAPDGNARGGYAGLSIRLARALTNPMITATADPGAVARNRLGFAASAAEFSGEIDGGAAGVAFFDHPANPRAPTRWYGILDRSVPFWFLNASLLQLEPLTLGVGQQFVLRYRVFIHPGRWDADRLRREHGRFARETDALVRPRR